MSAEDARNERQDKNREEQQFGGRCHLSGGNCDLKQNICYFEFFVDSLLSHLSQYHCITRKSSYTD